jgi:hypothetical protein
MKQTLCLLLVLVAGCSAQQKSTSRPVAVPDEATAAQIAEKALTRIYGRKVIESERPFTATLTNGIWHVVGSVNCGHQPGTEASVPCAGGAAMADIKQSNGRILKTGHTA